MRFSREFLDNRFFQQQMLTVDAWSQNIPMGPSVDDIGVRYEENGDVKLCLFAPQAKEVKVILATSPSKMRPVTMIKGNDGAFRGVLPFDPSFTGPVNVMVLYDGNPVLDPYLPICWTMNSSRRKRKRSFCFPISQGEPMNRSEKSSKYLAAQYGESVEQRLNG